MTINSETLVKLRRRSGFSQQDLADRAKISKRTIARLEAGEAETGNRVHTIRNLARALKVDAEVLSAPPSDDDINELGGGMQRVMTFVTSGTSLDFQMIQDRYGVSVDELVAAAPWMFTLLAEMSMLDRREKLSAARSNLTRLREGMASHLGKDGDPFGEVSARLDAEEASVVADDVLGKMLRDVEEWPEVEDHPFTAFLAEQAEKLKSPTVDAAELETQLLEPLPVWRIHLAWLNDLSGGDPVAAYALHSGLVRVSDIPNELREDARTAERVAFLRKAVSPEEKAQFEQNKFNQIKGEIK
ncbi:helix-turn-helix transcriptional regulator [Roseovarius sp. MBR-6]|jgi:transcriptional regulator with XRE-family HTH domain|uniref:helix-turn-helix domain-containing protein n=1 Tax=Roseovarius sp. MBR-6 TaxID=3156459 RepID=UPI00339509FF